MYVINGACFLIEIYVYLRKHRPEVCGGRLYLVGKSFDLVPVYESEIWRNKRGFKGRTSINQIHARMRTINSYRCLTLNRDSY